MRNWIWIRNVLVLFPARNDILGEGITGMPVSSAVCKPMLEAVW